MLAVVALVAGAPRPGAQSDAARRETALLEQAAKAETAFKFDVAAANLYLLLLEQPNSTESTLGRLRLARLLTLSGDLPGAILQCQKVRDELPADHPTRKIALDLATTLARRLKTINAATPFPTLSMVASNGLTALDEPIVFDFHSSGSYLLVDGPKGRAYRMVNDTVGPVGGTDQVAAATFLPDGTVVTVGKAGFSVGGAPPVPFTGAAGAKTGPLQRVRSIAALSMGDLLVIDRDFDGLLRCKKGGTSCTSFMPMGRFRVVKVGASDFTYVLDEKGQSLRVVDETGRQVAAMGPMLGPIKAEEIGDIAVDNAFGVYMLDKGTKRVHVALLRSGGANNMLTVVQAGSVVIPVEGDRGLKVPTAIAATPDGSVMIAGKASLRFLRLQ
jgi:hypothetical protein